MTGWTRKSRGPAWKTPVTGKAVLRALIALWWGLMALPAAAEQCRLALVLAGAPSVLVAVYEWSGRYNQEMVLDWTVVRGPADLLMAAETVAASQRSYNDFPTAMGYALGYGAGVLARGPVCLQQTLDMAGDGQNNEGFGPQAAYREFGFDAVTVNGLVVNAADYEAEVGLIAFYKAEVLHGPGAFMEVAQGFDDYERAMRRKLVRELSPPVFGALPRPVFQGGGPG